MRELALRKCLHSSGLLACEPFSWLVMDVVGTSLVGKGLLLARWAWVVYKSMLWEFLFVLLKEKLS